MPYITYIYYINSFKPLVVQNCSIKSWKRNKLLI